MMRCCSSYVNGKGAEQNTKDDELYIATAQASLKGNKKLYLVIASHYLNSKNIVCNVFDNIQKV